MTADDRRCLDERGYLVLPSHLTVSREILSRLETLFEQAGENAGHALRAEPFARTLTIDPALTTDGSGVFAPLVKDPQVLECVEYLLGGKSALTALRAGSLNPFALALDPLRPGPGPSTCWALWLLDNFTDDGTAALRVAPGSHTADTTLAVLPEDFSEQSITAVAGSVAILDGRLWRGDAANPGNRHLRTLRCEYIRRETGNSG